MTEVEPYGGGPQEESKDKARPALNVNRYATKKTIAQGMLDIALLTANASQLKYVLQTGKQKHPFYTLMLSLISVSIVLQVISGALALSMNMLRDCRLHLPHNISSAHFMNYLQLGMSIVIAAVNLVISAFDPAYSAGLDVIGGILTGEKN